MTDNNVIKWKKWEKVGFFQHFNISIFQHFNTGTSVLVH